MNRIGLERELKAIDSSRFQRIGDYLLEKQGYHVIPFGNCDGTNITRKGTPDSYCIDDKSENIVFVEYTVQKSDLSTKLIEDLEECFNKAKDFSRYRLHKIIYFINSNNIDSLILDNASKICSEKGIKFEFHSLFDICSELIKYKSIIKEVFNENYDENSFFSIDEFVDYTKALNGVDHSLSFISRTKDEEKIKQAIDNNFLTIITGEAGNGKSMLAVQILKSKDCNVLCIRSSNEEALDYISEFIKPNVLTILFIDDVNEVGSFGRFIKKISTIDCINLKIVCTVRLYAFKDLKTFLYNFSFPFDTIKIDRMSNESIKEILIENLHITNDSWHKKIIDLSRGNPRLAIMAGMAAIKKGVKCLINSKTVMKTYFEISTCESTKCLINEYYDILGFIAFLKRVDINNLDSYKEILDLFKLSNERIANNLKKLQSNELISLYENSVASIDDQNLSDYFVEKILIEAKCCSVKNLIIKCLKTNQKAMIESLNIVLNIYSDEDSRRYVESEVLKAWDELANTRDFDQFIKLFYAFNVEKSLTYLSSKITNEHKIYNGEPNNFDERNCKNEYVNITYHLYKRFNNEEAFSLLFLYLDYEDIRDDSFCCIKNLAKLSPNMFTKSGIKNEAVFKIKNYQQKPWFDKILFTILDEGLKYEYEDTSFNSEKEMIFSRFTLKDEFRGILEYRNNLWDLAKLLTDSSKYKLLSSFKNKIIGEESKKILLNDIRNINQLIDSIFKPSYLFEQLFKIDLFNIFSFFKIDPKTLKIHSERMIGDVCLIVNPKYDRTPYEERNANRSKKIKDFANKQNTKRIKQILKLADTIKNENPSREWIANDFSKQLISNLSSKIIDSFIVKKVLNSFSQSTKSYILFENYKRGNRQKVISLIEKNVENIDFIEAGFYIFDSLEKSEITQEISSLYFSCFKNDLKNNTGSNRRIDTLYIFSENDKKFVENIIELISIKDTNPNKFNSWINLLFNYLCFSPVNLVRIFLNTNKLDTLKELVFYFARGRTNCYELNSFVFEIAKNDSSFLITIVDKLINHETKIQYEILSNLWNQEDCFNFADIIFDEFVSGSKYLFSCSFPARYIFLGHDFNSDNGVFLEWALKKIELINDEKSIKLLTDLVSGCSEEKALLYYVKIIAKQLPLELFNELLHYPSMRSWTGSETTVNQSQISKFNRILSKIPNGLAYLRYVSAIKDYIRDLEENNVKIRIREKINFDYS